MAAPSSTINTSLCPRLETFNVDRALRSPYAKHAKELQTVLFLCARTSVRSVMAKAILTHLNTGSFRAFSAGDYPSSRIESLALTCLAAHGISTAGLRSKGWCELIILDAPKIHVVITLCKEASTEQTPSLPWHTPQYAHWEIPDPMMADLDSLARREAFECTFQLLKYRIEQFLMSPVDQLGPAALTQKASAIGALPFS